MTPRMKHAFSVAAMGLQYLVFVYLGFFAGLSADLFRGFAHDYRRGDLDTALRNFPLFVFVFLVFGGIILTSLVYQEKVADFSKGIIGPWQQRVVFVAAFISTAMIRGYYS